MADDQEYPTYEFGTEIDVMSGRIIRQDPWPHLVWRPKESPEDHPRDEEAQE